MYSCTEYPPQGTKLSTPSQARSGPRGTGTSLLTYPPLECYVWGQAGGHVPLAWGKVPTDTWSGFCRHLDFLGHFQVGLVGIATYIRDPWVELRKELEVRMMHFGSSCEGRDALAETHLESSRSAQASAAADKIKPSNSLHHHRHHHNRRVSRLPT